MKPLNTLPMAIFYINYSHDLGNTANPLTLTHSVILTSMGLTMTIRDVQFAQHDTLLSKYQWSLLTPFPISIRLCVPSSEKLDSGGGRL